MAPPAPARLLLLLQGLLPAAAQNGCPGCVCELWRGKSGTSQRFGAQMCTQKEPKPLLQIAGSSGSDVKKPDHHECLYDDNIGVVGGEDLGWASAGTKEQCCSQCHYHPNCTVSVFVQNEQPPHGRPGWDVFGLCDPHKCNGTNADTDEWYCADLVPAPSVHPGSQPHCQKPAPYGKGPPCPAGWLPCAGPKAHHSHDWPCAGTHCGCVKYVGGSEPTDTVLCAYDMHDETNKPHKGGNQAVAVEHRHSDKVCTLPNSEGLCSHGGTRCNAITLPRLYLSRAPDSGWSGWWRKLLSAVRTAANISLPWCPNNGPFDQCMYVVTLCPEHACDAQGANSVPSADCPPSIYSRLHKGCVNESGNSSVDHRGGGAVFDFDIFINDNVTRGAAIGSFLGAAGVAANASRSASSTPGAAELRQLGALHASLEPPPAWKTGAPVPVPTAAPGGGSEKGWWREVQDYWWYAVSGAALVAAAAGVAITRRVRFGENVDFCASRNPQRGMEGCLKGHLRYRRQEETDVDSDEVTADVDSDSPCGTGCTHSTSSSSDSEPEVDL